MGAVSTSVPRMPSRCFRAVAAGVIGAVVTQNTDGLHRLAGSDSVIELHGSGRTVACLDCGAREAREDVQARLEQEMPPRCRSCGGIHIKPTVVFFGEALPADAIEGAFKLASECDLMLVVGSSLAVYPAAGIPLDPVYDAASLAANVELYDSALAPPWKTAGLRELAARYYREITGKKLDLATQSDLESEGD